MPKIENIPYKSNLYAIEDEVMIDGVLEKGIGFLNHYLHYEIRRLMVDED